MLNKEGLIEVLKDNCKNWDHVSQGMSICEYKFIAGWRWENNSFHRKGEVITEFDVFPKPKKCEPRNRLIKELKENFTDWEMVCSHFLHGDMFWGFEWCNDHFRSKKHGSVYESDVFPKQPVCTGIVKQFKPIYSSETTVGTQLVYKGEFS